METYLKSPNALSRNTNDIENVACERDLAQSTDGFPKSPTPKEQAAAAMSVQAVTG
jgi:hypothetical protein